MAPRGISGSATGTPLVRSGVRLAVDPGTVRIGVARSDPAGVLATPLTVVRRGKGDLDALASPHDSQRGGEHASRITARNTNADSTRIDGQTHARPHQRSPRRGTGDATRSHPHQGTTGTGTATALTLSLIHISEPTRLGISYAVF